MRCRLEAEEAVQAALTDDMLALAGQLRAGAEAMAAALGKRDVALASAAQGLDASVAGVGSRVSATKRSVRRSRRGIWFTMLALLCVAGTFLGARLACLAADIPKQLIGPVTQALLRVLDAS